MNEPEKDKRLGPAGWVALVVLAGLLAVSLWYAIHAWTSLSDVPMSGAGWFFLILGALFTLALKSPGSVK